ncbi:MAG: BTAD domain-containing putative transcriptional regulator [Gemmatimonadales bacterium]
MLRLKTFGGLALLRDDQRLLGAAAQPRRMALLAMIARAGTRGISRERLQATLWPEADGEPGRNALKQALYALRKDAGAGDLFVGTRELSLNPDEVRCDVAEFEDLLRRNQLAAAVQLHDGPFLDGFRLSAVPEFENWVEDERRDLERRATGALDRLTRDALARGDATAAVQWGRRHAALEPLNERVTVLLMQALLAAGDRSGALRQARIYEELIAQEVDLPPHASVGRLAREIREGTAPSPIGEPPPPPTAPPPVRPPALPPPAAEPAPAADRLGVVVMPFTWIADAPGSHIAEGLSEELVSALGRRPDLRVSARVPGARLDAGYAVEGSVRLAGDELRVSARLVRVAGGTMLWSAQFDRKTGPILALQDELARTIAEAVDNALRQDTGLAPAPSGRERANALYLDGLQVWSPQGGGLGQGVELFRQAVALDPGHAGAHAALAESYTQLAFYGFLPALRAADLADAAANEAMRLAPDRAESHLARGTCLLWIHRQFDAGIGALEHALAIDPALVVAQARLAFVRLCHDGPLDTARLAAERAATMAGATGLSRVMFGQQLLAAGQYDEAIEALHAAIDIEEPSFLAYHWLTAAYVQKGMGREAVAAAVAESAISNRHPWSLMSMVVACAAAGQARRAEAMLEALTARAATEYVQASVLGQAHAALGDLDTGMALLGRALDEHDPSMMMVRMFPAFAAFRPHPRFRDLLRRAGWRDWDTAEFRIPDR